LRVEGVLGDTVIRPASATDDAASVGPVDLVLFCVKLWDTEKVGQLCRPLLGADTAVLTLQNGVDGPEILSRILGARHVMAGATSIFATIASPGVIHQPDSVQRIIFGELDGRITPRAEAIREAGEGAGIEMVLTGQIWVELWRKFVYLTALSGMTCYTRGPIGPVRDNPETLRMLRDAMAEAIAVGLAKGVALPPGLLEERMGLALGLAPTMRASMLHDLDHGNRLELPWLSGAVVRMGGETGVPTPTHRRIAEALLPYANGAARPSA
jgi:2-dehydropantoate 2-reductase